MGTMKLIPGEWRYTEDDGTILPWYTSPCLEWLMTLDLKGKRIFEYGVGDSTAWYRSKDTYVRGVDSNIEWAAKCHAIHESDSEKYTRMCLDCGGNVYGEHKGWDIISIDGVWRDQCTEYALKALKPGGYLILDNYHQASVPNDWTQTDKLIEGMDIKYFKEPGHPDWQTLVVTKP